MNASLDDAHGEGVLNENTNTVHKRRTGASGLRTECGGARHVERECLRCMPVERATDGVETSKCGRCFRGAGGY